MYVIESINILLSLNTQIYFAKNKTHDEFSRHLLDMTHKIFIALWLPPAIEDIKIIIYLTIVYVTNEMLNTLQAKEVTIISVFVP